MKQIGLSNTGDGFLCAQWHQVKSIVDRVLPVLEWTGQRVLIASQIFCLIIWLWHCRAMRKSRLCAPTVSFLGRCGSSRSSTRPLSGLLPRYSRPSSLVSERIARRARRNTSSLTAWTSRHAYRLSDLWSFDMSCARVGRFCSESFTILMSSRPGRDLRGSFGPRVLWSKRGPL